MTDRLRIAFAGTPLVAVPSLQTIADAPVELAGVVTRADAPLGRKRVLTPSPVAAAAAELGIELIKTNRLDAAATEAITALKPDLGVIVAYGGLVREPLLSAPTHGWINLHFSHLPRWRGAAPVQHALIAGDEKLGTSVFQLVAGLDAGDVFDEREFTPDANDTAGDALAALAEIGAAQLAEVISRIASGTAIARPQAGEVTLAPKLSIADGALDWQRPAHEVIARYRGVTPEPGAHTMHDGVRMKVLRIDAPASSSDHLHPGEVAPAPEGVWVGTATTPVLVTRVQPAGKAAMPASDWFRGLRGSVTFGAA